MNKQIEAVLKTKGVKPSMYFDLVNVFDYAELSVQKDGTTVTSLPINNYEQMYYGYEFGQKCTDTHYTINETDMKAVIGRMLDDMDAFLIEISMVDGSKVNICIYHTDSNEKTEVKSAYYETDILSLYEYLKDENHNVIMANIHDTYGFETKFASVKNCILEEAREYAYTMQITDESGSSITLPLVDDSCNEIYMKEDTVTDTFFIRPFGQPFMEISILVRK